MSKPKAVQLNPIEQLASKRANFVDDMEYKEETLKQTGKEVFNETRKTLQQLQSKLTYLLNALDSEENSIDKDIQVFMGSLNNELIQQICHTQTNLNSTNRKVVEYREQLAEIKLFKRIQKLELI